LEVFGAENEKFQQTLATGLKELEKLEDIDAPGAFRLYESYGLPYEIIKEVGGVRADTLTREAFDSEFKRHQEVSRAGNESKFGGHGVYLKTGEVTVKDKSELRKVTRLHTATHLMHAALRKVLGPEVKQNGSDITVDRTRFDFAFPRKLTDEELQKVENVVNDVIAEDVSVTCVEMPKAEAEQTGALFFFKEKYPERVKVYYMGRSLEDAFSKEFCGGPHVTHTGAVGKFKITKQESVGAGMRRVRAVLE
jgi:alanyl-tRNA synthetase